MKLLRATCDCGFQTQKARCGYHFHKWWFPVLARQTGQLHDVCRSLPDDQVDQIQLSKVQASVHHGPFVARAVQAWTRLRIRMRIAQNAASRQLATMSTAIRSVACIAHKWNHTKHPETSSSSKQRQVGSQVSFRTLSCGVTPKRTMRYHQTTAQLVNRIINLGWQPTKLADARRSALTENLPI